jgi:hypothetical protein
MTDALGEGFLWHVGGGARLFASTRETDRQDHGGRVSIGDWRADAIDTLKSGSSQAMLDRYSATGPRAIVVAWRRWHNAVAGPLIVANAFALHPMARVGKDESQWRKRQVGAGRIR